MRRIDDDQTRRWWPSQGRVPVRGLRAAGRARRVVEASHALPNAAASPTFYTVEPSALLAAMDAMDDLGEDLLGILHTHIPTEAYPSPTDVELAFYPEASYVLLSLPSGTRRWCARSGSATAGSTGGVRADRRGGRMRPPAQRVAARSGTPGPGRPLRAMSGPAGDRRLSPAPPAPRPEDDDDRGADPDGAAQAHRRREGGGRERRDAARAARRRRRAPRGAACSCVDDAGALRRFINIYVNDEDVRFLGGVDAKLSDGDEVAILPAVAGG